MNDNDIVLLFCNVDTAEQLLAGNEEVGPALVVADCIPAGEAIVVKKEEFLDWLYEKKEEENGKSLSYCQCYKRTNKRTNKRNKEAE